MLNLRYFRKNRLRHTFHTFSFSFYLFWNGYEEIVLKSFSRGALSLFFWTSPLDNFGDIMSPPPLFKTKGGPCVHTIKRVFEINTLFAYSCFIVKECLFRILALLKVLSKLSLPAQRTSIKEYYYFFVLLAYLSH